VKISRGLKSVLQSIYLHPKLYYY